MNRVPPPERRIKYLISINVLLMPFRKYKNNMQCPNLYIFV
jgi:hypothetical protein